MNITNIINIMEEIEFEKLIMLGWCIGYVLDHIYQLIKIWIKTLQVI
jgi:hypothetical protein